MSEISHVNNNINPRVDDEISLKDIVLKIKQWVIISWLERTKIILLSLVVGLTAAFYTKFTAKPSYSASYQLFFEGQGAGMSSAMRLASSFGLGSMATSSASSRAEVQEYLTSRTNIASAMIFDLENGRLIDRYYEEAFTESEEFNEDYELNFGINQRYTDSLITEVFHGVTKNNVSVIFDEDLGTLTFSVVSENERFTYDLLNQLVQNTENEFRNIKRKKSQIAVNAFRKKVDSLEVSIDEALYILGRYEDQNNSLVSAVDRMKRMRLTINLESLKVAYGEYARGLEMSKAEMMNIESPFKYFDTPVFPLAKKKSSASKMGILGSFITGFSTILFLIGWTEFKNIMA